MKQNYAHIQNCQKLHDAAVAQTIAVALKKICSFLSCAEMNSADSEIIEHIKIGHHLHDQEIGRIIKDSFKMPTQSFKPKAHVPHHAAH